MIKKIAPFALLGIAFVSLNACSNGYKKTKDGLEYKIVKDAKEGATPKVGDLIQMHIHIQYKDDKTDTTLFDSRMMNANQPVEFPLIPAQFKGDWPEGIMMLTAGDSAVFRVPVDSVMKLNQGQMPPFMKKGQKISYNVVLVSVKSQAEAMQQEQANSAKQSAIDDKILQDYFLQNNIHAEKTASGLYFVIEKDGSGANPTEGQVVTVNYTGKTLDGKPFDSNVDPQFQHVEPFTFPVGKGQVIKGWDEGVMLLKKGSKAKLFIPSPLAYGAQSPGPGIDANSVLMFDVEVTDIK